VDRRGGVDPRVRMPEVRGAFALFGKPRRTKTERFCVLKACSEHSDLVQVVLVRCEDSERGVLSFFVPSVP
jgi:hypothetical protein